MAASRSSPDEIKGRNMWMVWTGGNDRFWDGMTASTFGAFDLLKIVTSHPSQKSINRDTRWNYLGLINEPCFDTPTRPRSEALRPVARRRRHRLRARSVREREQISRRQDRRARQDRARGLLLRLCHRHRGPAAVSQSRPSTRRRRSAGIPQRYYNDPSYYNDPKLVRPYRVGMSCGFCHVGPKPGAPARRSRTSAIGRSQLHRGRAIHVGRPAVHL